MTGIRAQKTHATEAPVNALLNQLGVVALNQAQRILLLALVAAFSVLVCFFATATAATTKPTVLKQQMMSPKELDYA
jgi:hypothetical protein